MKAELKTIKGTWIGGDFEISRKLQIAESIEDAISGNEKAKGLGQSAADKMILNKFLTNQMDRARNKETDERNNALKDNLKSAKPDNIKKASDLLGFDISKLIG